MATKPSTRMSWAPDANFASGPANGEPTKVEPAGWPTVLKGFIPGTGIIAEFLNKVLNHIADEWLAWVQAGSPDGDTDAHIVETDSSGDTAVHQLTVDDRIQYLNTRTIVRSCPLAPAIFDPAVWKWDDASDEPWILQFAGATDSLLKVPLVGMPDGSTLGSVSMYIDGGNGHATDPIGGVPLVLTVYRQDRDGSITSLGSANDTTTRGTFQAPHVLTKSGINHVVDYENYTYWVFLSSEPASIWVADNVITALEWTCGVQEQAE